MYLNDRPVINRIYAWPIISASVHPGPYAYNRQDPPSEVPTAVLPVALVINGIAFECKLRLVEGVVD